MDYLDQYSVKVAIFDLDGTLVDSDKAISLCFNRAMTELGYKPRPVEEIARMIGLPLADMFTVYLTDKEAEEAVMRYRNHYRTVCVEQTKLLPGVMDLLGYFQRKGVHMAVATNKPRGFTIEILRGTGILPYFEHVVSPDNVARPKPDPAMIHEVMARLDMEPADTVYVGDSLTDCQTAANAGVRMFAVASGAHNLDELAETNPEWLGGSLADMKIFLTHKREG